MAKKAQFKCKRCAKACDNTTAGRQSLVQACTMGGCKVIKWMHAHEPNDIPQTTGALVRQAMGEASNTQKVHDHFRKKASLLSIINPEKAAKADTYEVVEIPDVIAVRFKRMK